jgi:hypothetical protein
MCLGLPGLEEVFEKNGLSKSIRRFSKGACSGCFELIPTRQVRQPFVLEMPERLP